MQAKEDIKIMLIGNKLDLVEKDPKERRVDSEKVQSFCHENKLEFMETSAFENIGVKDCFEKLLQGFLLIF